MTRAGGAGQDASEDLARLTRWEDSGGEWTVLALSPPSVTIALLSCDAGEEMDRLTTTDPAVLRLVGSRGMPGRR